MNLIRVENARYEPCKNDNIDFECLVFLTDAASANQPEKTKSTDPVQAAVYDGPTGQRQ